MFFMPCVALDKINEIKIGHSTAFYSGFTSHNFNRLLAKQLVGAKHSGTQDPKLR